MESDSEIRGAPTLIPSIPRSLPSAAREARSEGSMHATGRYDLDANFRMTSSANASARGRSRRIPTITSRAWAGVNCLPS